MGNCNRIGGIDDSLLFFFLLLVLIFCNGGVLGGIFDRDHDHCC